MRDEESMSPPVSGPMLTIGDFARASRLSAKVLRRYDELGLLPPARVDPFTGYRYYAVEQLERARLIAWLRRIDMPLTEVGRVCELYGSDAAAAARAIRGHWARIESETAARRDLATSLVDRLKGPTEMTDGTTDEMVDETTDENTYGTTDGTTTGPGPGAAAGRTAPPAVAPPAAS